MASVRVAAVDEGNKFEILTFLSFTVALLRLVFTLWLTNLTMTGLVPLLGNL